MKSIECGIALSNILKDRSQLKDWNLSYQLLSKAIKSPKGKFDLLKDRQRFSMDSYYPILSGCLNEDEKKVYLKEHINSFKGHLKDLASKNYRDIPALNSPDYVLLFVPIESALSLALSNDWDIQRTAMQNQMGFVTPTNLISILRMAESLWRLDAQNENASMIAKRAGLLIDKFSGLNDDITNIGKYLRLAERSFEGAENKLTSGKGNLFDQIKELEDLGAKSKKIIDQPKNISTKK